MSSENIDVTVTDLKMLPTLDKLGLINSTTVEVAPQRQVAKTENGFTIKDKWEKGLIDIQFNINGQKRWIPSKSYFKATARLSVNDLPPEAKHSIAFAESFMSNIIASCSFYIGNVCVSRMDDYVGQAQMILHRCNRDLNWLSTIGKDVYFLEPDFLNRQELSSSNGISIETEWFVLEDAKGVKYDALQLVGFDATGPSPADLHTAATFKKGTGGDLPDPLSIWIPGIDQLTYKSTSPGSLAKNIGDVANITGTIGPITVNEYVVHLVQELELVPEDTIPVNDVSRLRDDQTGETVKDRKNTIQIIFQLPLGIFNCKAVLPQGEFRFKITPKSDKLGAVQTKLSVLPAGWKMDILDFTLVNTIFHDSTSFGDGTYYLALDEVEIQNKKLNGGASLTSHNFILPQSTHKIALFAQDTSAGSIESTGVPPSRFRVSQAGSTADTTSLDIRHCQITFAGITKPSNLFESKFEESDKNNRLTQRYLWHQQNCENTGNGGAELYDDWLKRGWILMTDWTREKGDNSTQCQIQLDFGDLTTIDDVELFIVSFYRNICKVQVKNGLITEVLLKEG